MTYDIYTRSREFKVNLLSSKWLSKKLRLIVRENSNIKLTDIPEKAQKKWNTCITKCMAYSARDAIVDLINGFFKEQNTRLYDYFHELLRSNVGFTVKVANKQYIPTKEDLQ